MTAGRLASRWRTTQLGRAHELLAVGTPSGTDGPDPTVEVHRDRGWRPAGMDETITVRSRPDAGDGCIAVRSAATTPTSTPSRPGTGGQAAPVSLGGIGDDLDRPAARTSVTASTATSPVGTATAPVRSAGTIVLQPGDPAHRHPGSGGHAHPATPFDTDPATPGRAGRARGPGTGPRLGADGRASLADLAGLRAAPTRSHPDDVLPRAGSPWYLTLFGRDTLWAARLPLPLGTTARRGHAAQLWPGARARPTTARPARRRTRSCTRSAAPVTPTRERLALPAAYFGTVDATCSGSCCCTTPGAGACRADVGGAPRPPRWSAMGWMRAGPATPPGRLPQYIDESGSRARPTRAGRTPATRSPARRELATRPSRSSRRRRTRRRPPSTPPPSSKRSAARAGGSCAAGRHSWPPGSARLLGQRPGRRASGAGARRRQAAGRLPDQQHRPPPRHRDADREGEPAGRPTLVDRDLPGGFGLHDGRPNAAYNPIVPHAARSGRTTQRSERSAWPAPATPRRRPWPCGTARGRGLSSSTSFRSYTVARPRLLGRPVPYPAACRPQAWAAASAAAVVSGVLGDRVRTFLAGGSRSIPCGRAPSGSCRSPDSGSPGSSARSTSTPRAT